VVGLEQVLRETLAVGVERLRRAAARRPSGAPRAAGPRELADAEDVDHQHRVVATTARPDSDTIVGCGTPSASQISMIAKTTSLAYSWSV
jgi:hypothetical protein